MKERRIPEKSQKRNEFLLHGALVLHREGQFKLPEEQAKESTEKIRNLIAQTAKSLDEKVRAEIEKTPEIAPIFAHMYERKLQDERRENLMLARLLKKGTIPTDCINLDGTFQTDKIKEIDYFKENPHLIQTLGLYTRQLSEKSQTIKRLKAQANSKKEQPQEKLVVQAATAQETKNIEPIVEPAAINHKQRKKSKVGAAAAALLLAMTPTPVFKNEQSLNIPDKGVSASTTTASYPSVTEVPNTPRTTIPPLPRKTVTSMTKPVMVKRGDSEWRIVEQAVKDSGIKPTDATINVLTNITAWASLSEVPNPDVVKKGQIVRAPTVPLISCVDSRVKKPTATPLTEEQSIVNDIHALNELAPQSKKEVATEKKHTLKRITDYCKKVTIFSR